MKSVEISGVVLNYMKEGKGNPIIFVHGSLNDYRSWALQIGDFSSDLRAITFSRRCHYPNPWTDYPEGYSVRTERDDLLSFVSKLGIDRPVNLVGSSYGAFVALLVAQQRPEIVRSLVLGEPPIFSLLIRNAHMPHSQSDFEDQFEKRVKSPIRRKEFEDGVRGFINVVIGEGMYDRLSDESKQKMVQNARTLEYELTTAARDPFTIEDANRITVPALLLSGENSPLMFHLITQELRKSLPNSEHATIRSSSHSMHNQNPQAYSEAVRKFISRI